jgi:hypothetical protein
MAVDVGHLGQSLAERIEANDVGTDLTQSHGHRIDPQLQMLPEVSDLALLLIEHPTEAGGIGEEHLLMVAATYVKAERENAGHDRKCDAAYQAKRHRMRQIQLPRPPFAP